MQFQNETLEEVYNLAKENGLRVFTSCKKDKLVYFTITDGDKRMVYCQAGRWGAEFSSLYKPSHTNGSGRRLTEDPVTDVTLDELNEFLRGVVHYPYSRSSEPIQHYENWDAYLKSQAKWEKISPTREI